MGEQISLPYQKHSDTSLAAARKALNGANTQRARVYRLLWRFPEGLADFQIQEKLAMNPSTQRPRRIELVRDGLVRDSGHRRLTASNRKAVVWRIIAMEAELPRSG